MIALYRAFPLVALTMLLALPLSAQKSWDELRNACWGSNPDAPVTIEVYSDFSCPACRQLYLQTMRPVLADYALPGKVCVVYHEFPLRGNQYSPLASRYALAAARLGREEWVKVADALFTYQGRWSRTGEVESVVENALPPDKMDRVRRWVGDAELDSVINRERAEGRRRGVGRTPTLFITADGNTEKVVGAVQYGILRRYIESLLARR